MAKLRLTSVSMRNFGTVANATVEFPSHGLIHVDGLNAASDGTFTSVGSGKTLLGEAITSALFGHTGRYQRFADFSAGGNGDTYVAVEGLLDEVPLLVEQGYKCPELSKTGEGLSFTVGGSKSTFGNVAETRRALAAAVAVSDQVARWTIFVDGSDINFSKMSEKETVALLMSVLDQPPWEKYQRAALAASSKFQTLADSDNTRASQAQGRLDLLEKQHGAAQKELVAAEARLAQAEAEAEARRVELEAQIRSLTSAVAEKSGAATEAEKEMNRLVAEKAEIFASAEKKLRDASSASFDASRALRRITEKKRALESTLTEISQELEQRRRTWATSETARFNRDSAKAKTDHERATCDRRRDEETARKSATAAEKLVATLDLALAKAESNLELERSSSPPICKLEGCGKAWPKTNEAKIAELESVLRLAGTNLSSARLDLQACQQNLERVLGISTPVLADTPPIAAFDEQAANDSVSARRDPVAAELAVVIEREVAAITDLATKEAEEAELKASVPDTSETTAKIQNLSARYESLKKEVTSLEERKNEAKVALAGNRVDPEAAAAVTSSKLNLASFAAQRDAALAEMADAQTSFVSNKQAMAATDYWVEAYSPTGIPNLIIREAVTRLNATSASMTHRLVGGALQVSYSGEKVLKSGESRNEIRVSVSNKHGSRTVGGSSKGEGHIFNFAISETLADLGRVSGKIGYKWYDEVTGGMDSQVRRALFAYLREMAENTKTLVFIVDHSAEVGQYCHKTLLATKSDSGTTYSW